ncbi:uncharacterized protein LOC135841942 [Planococcus citri]|uniref:uncharacterized protein LOC135841942 n=1 Tax=Planococcus citri TaxID=170843 RepID=UPI0031F85F22
MWYTRYKSRHNFSLRTPEGVSCDRMNMSTEDKKEEFFKKYAVIMKKFNFNSNEIYNMDESGLQLVSRHPKVVCSRGAKRVIVQKSGERSETITIVACGNASGTIIIPPLVIFKGDSVDEDIVLGEFPPDTVFTCTEKGYISKPVFLDWFRIFCENIPRKRPVLLLLDGHSTHLSREVEDLALKEQVEIFCLTPHTSHLYQPMDVGIFKPMKSNFNAKIHKLKRTRRGLKRKHFGKAFTHAWNSSMTRQNLVSAFKGAGLWPMNKNAVDLKPYNNTKFGARASTSNTTVDTTSDTTLDTTSNTEPNTSVLNSEPRHSTPLKSPTTRVVNALENLFEKISPEKKVKKSRVVLHSRWITSEGYRKERQEKEAEKQRILDEKNKEKENRLQKRLEKKKEQEQKRERMAELKKERQNIRQVRAVANRRQNIRQVRTVANRSVGNGSISMPVRRSQRKEAQAG